MKTLAVRLTDELMDLLAVVSQIEGSTMVDQIREAIEAHLAEKASQPDFAEKAQAILDEIDREASARKDAIGSLFGSQPKTTTAPAPKGRSRRGQSAEPTAQLMESRPIGYLPARARRQGGEW
jgi:predicted DNA-binding protein